MIDKDEKLFKKLSKMGINNYAELLLQVPAKYIDCTEPHTSVKGLPHGEDILLEVVVITNPNKKGEEPPRAELLVADAEGQRFRITVFGNLRPWMNIKSEDRITVKGKLGTFNGELCIVSPLLIPFDWKGRVVPQYRGLPKVISSDFIYTAVQENFSKIDQAVCHIEKHFELTEAEIVEKANFERFETISSLLNGLHRPTSKKLAVDAEIHARKLAAYELVTEALKNSKRVEYPESKIEVDVKILNWLCKGLGFRMTSEQVEAVRTITDGLSSNIPLFTLLSGDVGTGKTAVFGICAAVSQMAHARVAILMPNLILVRQTYLKLKQWWPSIPIQMVNSETEDIDLSNNPMIIGTTAIFTRLESRNWKPNFMIVDEQAKFSVGQRERLVGESTNLLEATATCVPRTSALVMNGGMDLITLKQAPVQKEITTRIVSYDERDKVLNHFKQLVAKGGQGAIVYPNVDHDTGTNRSRLTSAVETSKSWEKHFPGRVGLIHGHMSDIEKVSVIERLERREIDILVATTIIEMGLDIPALKSIMVVEADRFGIASLHQIRGRVARAGGKGYFFMFSSQEPGQEAMDRMKALINHTDGFSLADIDMEIRGFGDLGEDSRKQSGLTSSSLFASIKITPSDLKQFIGNRV